jgi:GNAT superfamily N-acetyltransferase
MKIERESFSQELFDEVMPLAQKCWEESTAFKAESCAFYGEREFDIEPDFDTYQKQAQAGNLVIVTLRNESLLGYVIGFLYRSWHHRKIICANADTIYVEPDHRGHSVALMGRFEREVQGLGAQIIGWPTHANSPVYELLRARGYVCDDLIMEKRLSCVQ